MYYIYVTTDRKIEISEVQELDPIGKVQIISFSATFDEAKSFCQGMLIGSALRTTFTSCLNDFK